MPYQKTAGAGRWVGRTLEARAKSNPPKVSNSEEDKNAKQAIDANKKPTTIEERFKQLEQEGHGPQRHEGTVTEQMLHDRCVHGKDPMTGTTTDGVTGAEHKFSRNATKVNTPEDYVKAESHIRNSAEFKSKVNEADRNGLDEVVIKDQKLEDILDAAMKPGLPEEQEKGVQKIQKEVILRFSKTERWLGFMKGGLMVCGL